MRPILTGLSARGVIYVHAGFTSLQHNFEAGPEGPELEGLQVEKKSKAAQTNPEELIRRTCSSGHGSDGSGPK